VDRLRLRVPGRPRPAALAAALAVAVLFTHHCFAHSPVFDCFVDGDAVTCEGGFSDGASASGVAVRVLDKDGRVLIEGKIDADGRFSFPRPKQGYQVLFDAGAGHAVTVFGADITE
jgi:hypothetical protein